MNDFRCFTALMLAVLLVFPGSAAFAASHREAPITALDHPADITDFFAFVSYDKPDHVTFLLNVDPLLEPSNGPNYFPFDPDVLYTVKIDNDYDAVADITLEFRFQTEVRAPGVFTGFVGAGGGINSPSNAPKLAGGGTVSGPLIPPAITALDGSGSEGFNLRQTYTVTMVQGTGDSAVRTDLAAGKKLIAVPSNVGPRTMPNYASLARQGIYSLDNDIRVFAGTVDDPFYIDLGAAFDSLNFRQSAFFSNVPGLLTAGEDSNDHQNMVADSLSGFNVNTIAIEIPTRMLIKNGKATIGTWGATYRPEMTVRRTGDQTQSSGAWIQVQRMANPLINELIIGTGDKDKWSMTEPKDDAQFASYDLDPLLARVLNAIYGIQVPDAPRTDLLPLVQYMPVITGAPSSPKGPVADLLRLNTGIAPKPADQRSRLGVLGGDSAGFPNGRRVSDDVVDIATRAVAGALDGFSYLLGDGVNTNDIPYQETFPYVAFANSGRNRRHVDPGERGCRSMNIVTSSGASAQVPATGQPCPID
ncbi:MAG TPA: DUF4331 domain-containing protein [Bryobacteraceae bacterium]